jgi:D-arabinose 1-dehydrogenase-like Zn-dependent alcohol dehydrogenase
MTMRAALLKGIGAPFEVKEIPEPRIGPEEVLVRTKSCGICRTDLHIQDGLAYIPDFPHVPGHEPAGVVEAVGSNVDSIRPGQRVAPHLFLSCGKCRYCRRGMEAQCTNLGGVIGVTTPGGFAEYFKAPARNLLVLPENVPFAEGGLVSCAVITAVHAYRRARLELNDVALVLGAGGIGQILVQMLRAAGVRVIAAGRSTRSLEAARRDGAELGVCLKTEDLHEKVRAFTDGEGADCIFECVGTAETMKAAAHCTQRGGQIIVIGEEAEYPAIDTIQIAQRELEIIGSRNGGLQDARDAMQMIGAGLIRPPIAARFPLEAVNEALTMMRAGQASGRLILEL